MPILATSILTIRGNQEGITRLREFVAGETLPARTSQGFDLVPEPLPFCFHNIIPVPTTLLNRSDTQWFKEKWGCSGPPFNVQLLRATPIELVYRYDAEEGCGRGVLLELSKRFPKLFMDVHYETSNFTAFNAMYLDGKSFRINGYNFTPCQECGEFPSTCICKDSTVVMHQEAPKQTPKPLGRRISITKKKATETSE